MYPQVIINVGIAAGHVSVAIDGVYEQRKLTDLELEEVIAYCKRHGREFNSEGRSAYELMPSHAESVKRLIVNHDIRHVWGDRIQNFIVIEYADGSMRQADPDDVEAKVCNRLAAQRLLDWREKERQELADRKEADLQELARRREAARYQPSAAERYYGL